MNIDDYPELEPIKDAILVLSNEQEDAFELEYMRRRKNHRTTFFLCLLFGFFSIQRFYLGNKKPIGFILLFHALGLLVLQFFGIVGSLFLNFVIVGNLLLIITLLLFVLIQVIAVYDLCTFKKITREANIRIACETIKGITESKNSSSTNKS